MLWVRDECGLAFNEREKRVEEKKWLSKKEEAWHRFLCSIGDDITKSNNSLLVKDTFPLFFQTFFLENLQERRLFWADNLHSIVTKTVFENRFTNASKNLTKNYRIYEPLCRSNKNHKSLFWIFFLQNRVADLLYLYLVISSLLL